MKNMNKFALLAGLGALLPLAAPAKTLEQSYIESCRRGDGIPVPVAVVSPHVDGYDIGETVQVEFVVDTTGRTSDISVTSTEDHGFAAAVVNAVRQWRFAPALHNGAPVAATVILPVRCVELPREEEMIALE